MFNEVNDLLKQNINGNEFSDRGNNQTIWTWTWCKKSKWFIAENNHSELFIV